MEKLVVRDERVKRMELLDPLQARWGRALRRSP